MCDMCLSLRHPIARAANMSSYIPLASSLGCFRNLQRQPQTRDQLTQNRKTGLGKEQDISMIPSIFPLFGIYLFPPFLYLSWCTLACMLFGSFLGIIIIM
jgi:hypothetical protein